jgi:hypothetical protein
LNTSLKLRTAKDLYWNFSYYLNVDSRPPQGLPRTDYGSYFQPGVDIWRT